MRARLFCRTGEMTGSTCDLSGDVTIGRGTNNDLVLHAGIISDRHARIRVRSGQCFLEDLESANGTELDGMPVKSPVRLGTLHVITFAKEFDFVFQVLEEGETPLSPAPGTGDTTQPKAPDAGARAASSKAPAAGRGTRVDTDPFRPLPELDPATGFGKDAGTARGTLFQVEPLGPLPDLEAPAADEPLPRLSVQFSEGRRESHALRAGANTIGRAPECDVTLAAPSLSRQHARIMLTDTSSSSPRRWGVTIEDLGSLNGTRIDGKVISGVVELRPGAKIVLGPEVVAELEIP
jgi:pSer/pThr/pTyr-binding forkhead associated (FHA) protein